jgi:hypothetical protein
MKSANLLFAKHKSHCFSVKDYYCAAFAIVVRPQAIARTNRRLAKLGKNDFEHFAFPMAFK